MTDNISREEFVRSLTESGLLPEETLRATTGAPGRAVDDLAADLIRSGHLTPFQADAIRRGRPDELFLGNYVVLEKIGTGGMGTVFKARHRRMKRAVALKVLRSEADDRPSFAKRFQREVETIAQLNHPNIVMAYDADESDVGPFLVMEYIDGRDLRAEVQQGGPLSVAEAVDSTLQAARGLEYAHGRGFIHRDVKPANLLRDARGTTKVADLGLARLAETEAGADGGMTQFGNVLGTAEYMAPEQALDSSSIDARADIYALGCTLFFLLAGRAPYSAPSLMGLLLKHREAPIPSLRDDRPEVPPALDATFRRMVAKGRDDRFATMTEAIAALEAGRAATDALDIRPVAWSPAPGSDSVNTSTVAADTFRPMALDVTHAGESESGAEAVPDSSEVRRVADLRVVLVEPSRLQARIVRGYLREMGIEAVSLTVSGAEALAILGREGADVVLSAMHLADMTGTELVRALRASPESAEVGFVLASGESEGGRSNADPRDPRMALLKKPFDVRDLARSLAQATGRSHEETLTGPG